MMYRFKVSYHHPKGIRVLGFFYGSRGSVLEDVLRDHEDLSLDLIIVERAD